MALPRLSTFALFLLLTGCGNKGPLFLPPPAVQQPEPAASAPATPAATTSTQTPAPESPEPATPAGQ